MSGSAIPYINRWGHRIPSPQQVLGDLSIRPHVQGLVETVGGLIGLSHEAIRELLEFAADQATATLSSAELERAFKARLVGRSNSMRMSAAIRERSAIVFNEIAPFLGGRSLLDMGCGNGLVAGLAESRFEHVQLVDVMNYVDPGVRLPFARCEEGSPLPVAGPFDTVLLLTVLHHSADPLQLLRDCWSVTRQRLIVIESVFGMYDLSAANGYALTHLSESAQIAFAVFVDWLYNRVLMDGISVPYNFTTPERWSEVFATEGMRVHETRNLGQDVIVAPELHFMFVLDKS